MRKLEETIHGKLNSIPKSNEAHIRGFWLKKNLFEDDLRDYIAYILIEADKDGLTRHDTTTAFSGKTHKALCEIVDTECVYKLLNDQNFEYPFPIEKLHICPL